MTESYWQKKGRSRRIERRQRKIPDNCDIAVIGAGISGVAIAHFLRQFGCDNVVVLEKDYIGYGASGRNAGFLLAGLSEPYSRLREGMGLESAKELMTATVENHDLIAGAIKEKAIKCDYDRSGSYHLAVTEVERNEYDKTAELLDLDGFEVEKVSYPVKTAGGSLDSYLGGYFCPDDGSLDPYAFVRGLSRDIDIQESYQVHRVEKSAGAVNLVGPQGSLKCEMAIIATNGYSPLLDRFFKNLVFPIRGQMMATSPLDTRALDRSIYYANFGYDYFRQHVDNSLLVGGLRNRYLNDELGFEDAINTSLQLELVRYAGDNLGTSHFEVECRWSGLMGGTIDGLPLVGALPHNSSVIVSAGYNGHGFGLGMVVARDLARAIMQGESSFILERFSLRRFL